MLRGKEARFLAPLRPPSLGGHTLKTRIASTLALAAAIVLGLSGCGLFAPQATLEPYAPSDGVEASLQGVDVRNLLLVAAEDGEHFNVVFTGVNTGSSPVQLRIAFEHESTSASADFVLEPGIQAFGDPAGENGATVVSLPGLSVGATVTAYVQVAGAEDREVRVPVLDGTLVEYQPYVLASSDISGPEDEEIAEEQAAGEEASEPSEAGDAAE
jgi:hypothetical protein